jgi:type II secretory pathway component PulM
MSPKSKIHLTLVIVVIAVILLFVLLNAPLIKGVKTLSADFKEKNNLLASYREKGGDYLIQLRNEHAKSESKVSEIQACFVDSEKAIDFILAIEQVAVATGNYQEKREIASEEKNTLSFQVSLWGSFSNLIKFLAQLENMKYFVNVDSFTTTRIVERELRDLVDKGIVVPIENVRSVLEIKVYTK